MSGDPERDLFDELLKSSGDRIVANPKKDWTSGENTEEKTNKEEKSTVNKEQLPKKEEAI